MVYEKDMHGGVTPVEEAVDAKRALAEDRCGDEGNGDDV